MLFDFPDSRVPWHPCSIWWRQLFIMLITAETQQDLPDKNPLSARRLYPNECPWGRWWRRGKGGRLGRWVDGGRGTPNAHLPYHISLIPSFIHLAQSLEQLFNWRLPFLALYWAPSLKLKEAFMTTLHVGVDSDDPPDLHESNTSLTDPWG